MKPISGVLTAFLTMLFLVSGANATTYFTGNLSSAQEVPPTNSTATGFGRVTLNDAENQITYSLTFSGLSANQTASHIHGPATPSGTAPVLFNIGSQGTTSGTFTALTAAVTPAQVADLKAGLYYFNVHSTAFPNGEIRGQITLDSPFLSSMNKDQENPPTASPALGNGAVSLNAGGTQAFVTMNWSGLTGNAIGGHVHAGRVGVNGPIICDLTPPSATAGSVVDRLCTFTPAQVVALKQAQLYLNLHTPANPAGEIRGQIQRRRSTVLDFDGDSRTDYAVVRNDATAGSLTWFINNSANNSLSTVMLGATADFNSQRLLGGDFDGDGKDDVTVWRSGTPAFFFIFQSSTNTVRIDQFGQTNDDPRMIYDYDGDGRTDLAVYRPGAQGFLYYRPSANNPSGNFVAVPWGTTGDLASPGDYDGDGKGDICLQRNTTIYCNNSTAGFKAFQYGLGSDFFAPGDYDGDGKTDLAAVRSQNPRAWYILRSSDNTISAVLWGTTASIRTQGDYDGDGKTDVAVWQNSPGSVVQRQFAVLPSNGGPASYFDWGLSTDLAVAGYNSR